MRENLNAIKRFVAFCLTLVLIGTTLWDDVFVIANQENPCQEFVDLYSYDEDGKLIPGQNPDGLCDICGHDEASHIKANEEEEEAEDTDTASETDEEVTDTEDTQVSSNAVQDTNSQDETPSEDIGDSTETPSNSNDIEDTTSSDNSGYFNPAAAGKEYLDSLEEDEADKDKTEDTETADDPEKDDETDKDAVKECEHQWEYTSNKDGTHLKKCSECGEESTENCDFDDEGKCKLCGYEKPVEEEECDHDWEYISNNDGTHMKKCKKCDEEEKEDCQLNADGVCELCGYEDERLVQQSYSRTIHGVTVTVAGMMPRGSKVTIFTKPLEKANRIVNDALDEGHFTALEVFDIDVYTRGGIKYQPMDNGDELEITFSGVKELAETSEDEEIVVYRIEDDDTVTEVESEVVGEEVTFDAEHFSGYVVGTFSYSNYLELASYMTVAYIGEGTTDYTKISGTQFYVEIDEDTTYTVTLRKNLTDPTNPESGEKLSEQTYTAKIANGSKGYIEADFGLAGNDNAYITKGNLYSVVVSADTTSKLYIGDENTNTYLLDQSVSSYWQLSAENKGIFWESAYKDTTAPTDNHKITAIKATKGDLSNTTQNGTYIYCKQKDTSEPVDTLTAVFDADIDRTVTWSSDNTNVVEINSTTGAITAKSTGQATITATYTANEKKTVVVKVMEVTLDNWDPDAAESAANKPLDLYYNGEKIDPTIKVVIGDDTLNSNISTSYSNDKVAGTATASLSYTTDGKTYNLSKQYEIKRLPLTRDVFANAKITLDSTGGISAFENLAAIESNPTSNADKYKKNVTPKYTAGQKDFSYTVTEITPAANGIQYVMDIEGTGNFSGSLAAVPVYLSSANISSILGVRLSSNSALANCLYTGNAITLTETTSDGTKTGWAEVEFYNIDSNATVSGIITPDNCVATITNASGQADSTSAGTHNVVFTMKSDSGYTGSLSVSFEIKKPSLRNAKIVWREITTPNERQSATQKYYHTGQAIKPKKGTDFTDSTVDFVVYESDGTTPIDTDNYEVSYSGGHTDIGVYTLTITGKKNYDPETTNQSTYEIIPEYSLDMRVRLYVDSTLVKETTKADNYESGYTRTYVGSDSEDKKPTVKVYIPGEGELADSNFEISYCNSAEGATYTRDVGTKYIIITPKQTLIDSYPTATVQKVTYKITQCSLDSTKIKVTRNPGTHTYDNTVQTLQTATNGSDPKELMVRYGTTGDVLVEGTDYTVSYSDNKNAGKATYVIEAKKDNSGNYSGNYTGTIAKAANYFTIDKAKIYVETTTAGTTTNNGGTITVGNANPATFEYDGTEHKPSVTVTFSTTGNPVPTSEYVVSYSSDCISPTGNTDATKAYVQIDGQNNVEGTTRRYFNISSNTKSFADIKIDGKSVINNLKDTTTGTTVTRYYVLDDNTGVLPQYFEYTGKKITKSVVIYGINGQVLNQPGEKKSYSIEFKNTDKAKDYDLSSTSTMNSSPRLIITGLNNYAGNNAVVFFNVKKASLKNATINLADDKIAYPSPAAVVDKDKLSYTVTYNGNTLTEDTDFTVTCYDYDEDADGVRHRTTLSTKAGTKVAVFSGINNFSSEAADEVEKEYIVGSDISTASIKILHQYTDVEFLPITALTTLVKNYGTEATALTSTVKYQGDAVAPRIIVYASSTALSPKTTGGTTYDYELTMTPKFGANNYRARKVDEETSDNFNKVEVVIDADTGTTGYYGKATFWFVLEPKELGKNNGSVTADGITSGDSVVRPYTGSKQTVTPIYTFSNGSGETPYTLNSNSNKDFTPESYEIGPNLSSTITTKLYGIGNFTGEVNHQAEITRGYVQVWRTKGTTETTDTPVKIGQTEKHNYTDLKPQTPDGKCDVCGGLVGADVHNLTTTYKLSEDSTQTYYVAYKYKPNVEQCPVITLTASDGTTALKEGVDYTIEYPTDKISAGTKTITVTVPGSHEMLYGQEIKITYVIETNSIAGDSYIGSLSDIEYAKSAMDASKIANRVADGSSTLTLKIGDEELKYGANNDYVIVTTDELTEIKKQVSGETAIQGDNNIPGSGTTNNPNWFYVKGVNQYSGYKKIYFNHVLNISSTAYADVSMDGIGYYYQKDGNGNTTDTKIGAYYNLNADGNLPQSVEYKPIIKYLSTSDTWVTLANPLDHVTVTRANEGKPGPDPYITVTAKANSACTGVKTQAQYEIPASGGTKTYEPIYFLADLSTYKGITMTSGTVYEYTDSAVTVTFTGLGTAKEQVSAQLQGDYRIAYTQEYTSYATTSEAIDVGAWFAVIVPVTDRNGVNKYFIPGTTSVDRFKFNIKYNLSNATAKIYSNGVYVENSTVPYTGDEIDVPIIISVVDEGDINDENNKHIIYNYKRVSRTSGVRTDTNTLVKINPEIVTEMGPYTIRAEALDNDKVYGTLTKNFEVGGISIEGATVTLSGTSFPYTGSPIKPTVTVAVTVQGKAQPITLRENTDYTVSYASNINAGENTAKVIIKGANAYSGAIEKTFTITPVEITASMVTVAKAYYAGGAKVEPKVTIKNGTHTLKEGTDYKKIETSDYGNNQYATTASTVNKPYVNIVVKDGIGLSGNYTISGETLPVEFSIEKLDLRSTDITVDPSEIEWTGTTIDPYDKLTVKLGDTELMSKKNDTTSGKTACDYEITVLKSGSGSDLKDMGSYTLRIDGLNNCEGSIEKEFEVTKRSLPNNYHHYYSGAGNKFVGSTWTYDKENKRWVSTKDDENSTDTLTIYVYDVEQVGTTDNPTNVPRISIVDSGAVKSIGNDGTAVYGYELNKGTDYTLSVANSSKAGSAEWSKDLKEDDTHALPTSSSPAVTITGTGNYTGSITLPYDIGKNLNTLTNLTITYTVKGYANPFTYNAAYDNPATYTNPPWQYEYNGETQQPSVTVKYGTKTLSRTRDFTVTYTDVNGDDDSSIDAGVKHVVVTGIGDYCGTMSQFYTITRKAVNAQSTTFGKWEDSSPWQTSGGEYSFAMEGNSVVKLTSDTAKTYLVDTGLLTETEAAEYVGYYYAVYNGEPIEPSITVTDNKLGASGTVKRKIDKAKDLSITYNRENVVTTKNGTQSAEKLLCSEIVVGFQGYNGNTTGNYYVASDNANSVQFTFKYIIASHDIEKDFTVKFLNGTDGNKYDYKGSPWEPLVQVSNGTRELNQGEDYELIYKNNLVPGVATVTVNGIGNYIGSKTLNFYIWGDLSKDYVKVCYKDSQGNYVEGQEDQIYTGTYITYGDPRIYLVLENQTEPLRAGIDYEANIKQPTSDNDYIQTGTVTYTGLGESKDDEGKPKAYWVGDKVVDYNVQFDTSGIKLTNYAKTYKYTGNPIEPDFKLNVTTGTITSMEFYRMDNLFTETTDFTSVGKIKVVAHYKVGSKTGTIDDDNVYYEIKERPMSDFGADDTGCYLEMNSVQRYTTYAVKPTFTLYIQSYDLKTGTAQTRYNLQLDTDYTVDYGNYVYGGDPKIVLTGKSPSFTGTKNESYTIKLQDPAVLTVTEKTGDSLTVTWVKDLFADGTMLELQEKTGTDTYTTKTIADAVKKQTMTFDGLKSSTQYKIIAKSYASGVDDSDGVYTFGTTDISENSIHGASNTKGKATITWDTDVSVEVYYIYRSDTEEEQGTLIAIIPASTGRYTNTKLSSGTTYYYHVEGYNILTDGTREKVNTSAPEKVTIK